MSPPISKDWWLAAALSSAALPTAMSQPAATTPRGQSGVVTTAIVQGGGRGASSAPVYVESGSGQRLTTGPNQSLHVLFSDQSAMTLAPNSDIVISQYLYDTQAKSGQLLVRMTRGLLRVVGGFISKSAQTTVVTPTSTVGIRGGITLVQVDDVGTRAVFLFGESMVMTSSDGSRVETVTRPGFGTSSSTTGVTAPERTPASTLTTLTALLESGQPRSTPEGQAPDQTNPGLQQVGEVAPDRIPPRSNPNDTPGVPRSNTVPIEPPTLSQILGSQGPGNQS